MLNYFIQLTYAFMSTYVCNLLSCSFSLHTYIFLFLQLPCLLQSKQEKSGSYYDAKQAAVEYQAAKETLIKEFQKSGLGMWVKKPIEQDQFVLSV